MPRQDRATLPRRPAAAAERPVAEPPRVGGARLGRYELLFELAQGGNGTVHVARMVGAHGFDRLVAIKLLKLARNAPPSEVEDFVREARLTARLHHANVVQTLELGDDDGTPFIVMELVQGVSLNRLLGVLDREGRSLDPDLAGWILEQAARGLAAAHALEDGDGSPLHLVHRDVSPHNILLSFDGRVAVADFGIAKLVASPSLTQAGVIKGKVGYMAPEQTRGELVDCRADVFCLGIVFFEMLWGKRLFEGDSPVDSFRRIAEASPPDLRVVRPDLPIEWIEIAERCLAKSRDDRYPDAKAVADAARGVLKARRAAVAASDVAALLAQEMDEERRRLQERLRAGSETAPRLSPEPVAEAPVTATVTTTEVVLPLRRVARGCLAIPALAAIAAIAYATTRESRQEPSPSAPAEAPMSAAAIPTPVGSMLPVDRAAPSRTDPTIPVASASVAPSSSSIALPRPPPPAAPGPTPAASIPPPPSVKGVPFQSLDD